MAPRPPARPPPNGGPCPSNDAIAPPSIFVKTVGRDRPLVRAGGDVAVGEYGTHRNLAALRRGGGRAALRAEPARLRGACLGGLPGSGFPLPGGDLQRDSRFGCPACGDFLVVCSPGFVVGGKIFPGRIIVQPHHPRLPIVAKLQPQHLARHRHCPVRQRRHRRQPPVLPVLQPEALQRRHQVLRSRVVEEVLPLSPHASRYDCAESVFRPTRDE